MLRWTLPLAIALFAIPPADAADGPAVAKSATVKAARQLPAGLPHRHYAYRTTITSPTYVRRGRQLVVVEQPVVSRSIPSRTSRSYPANRCCRGRRRCPAITATGTPTTISARTTAVPM